MIKRNQNDKSYLLNICIYYLQIVTIIWGSLFYQRIYILGKSRQGNSPNKFDFRIKRYILVDTLILDFYFYTYFLIYVIYSVAY